MAHDWEVPPNGPLRKAADSIAVHRNAAELRLLGWSATNVLMTGIAAAENPKMGGTVLFGSACFAAAKFVAGALTFGSTSPYLTARGTRASTRMLRVIARSQRAQGLVVPAAILAGAATTMKSGRISPLPMALDALAGISSVMEFSAGENLARTHNEESANWNEASVNAGVPAAQVPLMRTFGFAL